MIYLYIQKGRCSMVVKKMMLLMVAIAFLVSIAVPVSFAASCGSCVKPACNTCTKPAPCNTCPKPACPPCDKCAGDPLKKLGRGLSNCLTFVIEVPNQISKTNNCEGPAAAATVGLVKGVVMAAFRAVVGAYEVATFPFPLPECYKPILTDPEYMLENCTA